MLEITSYRRSYSLVLYQIKNFYFRCDFYFSYYGYYGPIISAVHFQFNAVKYDTLFELVTGDP